MWASSEYLTILLAIPLFYVLSYSISLLIILPSLHIYRYVLADPELVLLFREHLKGSYSSENLAFIVEVENFKDLWNQGAVSDHIKKRANEIFNKYFSSTSTYELNIPGPLLEDLKDKMKIPNTTLFNKVQQSIFKLVENDSYPRFVRDPNFQKYIDGK